MLERILRVIKTPSARWGVGVLLGAGFLIGILSTGSLLTFVDSTSTEEFCISCHEMRAFPFAEFEESAHYASSSGVRPNCNHCHVPPKFIPKMGAKIRATFVEIPGHLMGNIDTPEKFEAKREELAQRVWNRLEANDSAPCRGCHDVKRWVLEEQSLRAAREHEAGFAEGDTCIDCHKGIAHKLPASMLEEEAEKVEFDF